MNKSSLEAAAEAAAKVNAMLIAKGKLKPSISMCKTKASNNLLRGLSEDLITAEVDINDAPQSARNMLTRGHSQDEICKFSGASISTRGRYMTLEERQNISTADCRPLYLHVQASAHESVSLAVSRIQDIINQHVIATGGVKSATVGVVTYPAKNTNGVVKPPAPLATLSSGPHFVQDKVFIGLEHSPSNYPVREKILGPNGTFLQHIRTETGANVTLRGRGSGFIEPTSGREAFEPLYIHITHPKVEGLQAAKALAINLVDTAHVEFFQWQKQQRTVIQPVTPVVIPQVTPLSYQSQGVPSQTVIAYPATYVANPTATLTRTAPTASSIVGVMPLPVSAAYTLASSEPTILSSQPGTLTPLTQYHTPVQTLPITQSVAYANIPTSQAHLSTTVLPESSVVVAAADTSCFATMPQEYVSNPPSICSDNHVQEATTVIPMSIVQRVETVFPHAQYSNARMIDHNDRQYTMSHKAMKRDNIGHSRPSLQKSTNSNHPTEPGTQMQQKQSFMTNQMAGCLSTSMDRDLMPPPLNINQNKKLSPLKRSYYNENPRESDHGNQEAKKLRGALLGIASVYGSDDSSDEESSFAAEAASYSKSLFSSNT